MSASSGSAISSISPGQGPRAPTAAIPTGKVGKDVTVEQAYEHAKTTGLGLLAAMKEAAGSLDKVEVIKLLGMVNAVPDFADQPKVINGCSDLFVAVLGENGRHARSAVGMGSLPGNMTGRDRSHHPGAAMTALAEEIARVYGTPAVVIDLDKVEANIARLQAACDAAGVANRPHIKTHKSPELARLQREAGARGITCQKLGEAEVMADGGHRRHPDQLQHPRRGEARPAGRSSSAACA